MAYEDVPQRLLDGEAVPRSEIIAYLKPMTRLEVDYRLFQMELVGALTVSFASGVKTYSITPFGNLLRRDFVKRIEGDCPECP